MLGLLVLAMVVAIVARRLALPYTVGLAVTGGLVASFSVEKGVALTPGLIYDVILPPLLFEGALKLDWTALRRDLAPVMTLTFLGVIISAGVVAAGVVFGLGWPAEAGIIFGVLIAATDPISVIATFKDNRMRGRLSLFVEAESLFNDGVAAVLYAIVLLAVGGHATGYIEGGEAMLRIGGGGIAIGLGCGLVAMLAAGRSGDHLVETTITVITAYGAFLLAENMRASGVLATVAAGLLIGNFQPGEGRLGRLFSVQGSAFIHDFWDFAAFIANSIIFILIGVSSARLGLDRATLLIIGVAIVLVLAGRALSVYPICLLFRRTRWALPLRDQHVVWWAGLRGALGLALALSLPDELAQKHQIVTATFGVVLFSIIVQGATMPVMLRRLKLLPGETEAG
jgi:CPA1 family monovalent cation:H+ antiporter